MMKISQMNNRPMEVVIITDLLLKMVHALFDNCLLVHLDGKVESRCKPLNLMFTSLHHSIHITTTISNDFIGHRSLSVLTRSSPENISPKNQLLQFLLTEV